MALQGMNFDRDTLLFFTTLMPMPNFNKPLSNKELDLMVEEILASLESTKKLPTQSTDHLEKGKYVA